MLAGARRQFLDDYARIRSAEGRGSNESAYYRALPFTDLSGRNSEQWRIRARTYRYFVDRVLPRQRSKVLDLGAGNCWLSYRLAESGHEPVSVDIFSDPRDGLGAARHYPVPFPTVEADFDRLPFTDSSFDLVVFNASVHYSPDYGRNWNQFDDGSFNALSAAGGALWAAGANGRIGVWRGRHRASSPKAP